MDFSTYLKESASQIDLFLDKFLTRWVEEVSKTSPKLKKLVQVFADACQGGKKLRGTLVKLGYEMGKKSSVVSRQSPDIIKIGAAYEIFHASILVHDDIIDQSPIRRGKPSLYQALGGDHYGISQAICLGDAGFFLATQALAESNFPEKEKNEALKLFSQTMVETAIGQMLDLSKGDPATIMRLKTAKYTVSGPLQIGIILAGVSPTSPRLRRIKEFGENLGIAFQIKDDILDGEVESLDLAKAQALKYMDKARKIIPTLTEDTTMRILLNELVDYMVERKK